MYALRGLYDVTPLLLAIALGVITAYLAVQFCRIFRVRDLRIQNIRLKREGHITWIGRWAVGLLAVWFAFNLHSFFVQYHRYRGRERLNQITATWPELLNQQPLRPFTQEDQANIDAALKSLRVTDQIGFADVLEVKLGLVYANLMKGDMESAEKYLREAYRCDSAAVREMLMEFLVSQDRQQEAAEIL